MHELSSSADRQLGHPGGAGGARRPSCPARAALLAYVGDELRAALGLRDGQVVADPFHRTADIVEMLRVEARFEEAA